MPGCSTTRGLARPTHHCDEFFDRRLLRPVGVQRPRLKPPQSDAEAARNMIEDPADAPALARAAVPLVGAERIEKPFELTRFVIHPPDDRSEQSR